MKRPPSIAQIAQKAGMAPSTISLALRNDPRVAEKQRLRIQKLAAKMGYQANPLLSRLMFELRKNRKKKYVATLAAINLSPIKSLVANTASETWLKGAHQRCWQLGYSLDCFGLEAPGEPFSSIEHLLRMLRSRGIQGVVLYGYRNEEHLQQAKPIWEMFPTVAFGAHPKDPALNHVGADQYSIALLACEHLIKSKCQRIGIVLDRWVDALVEHRFIAGYLAGTWSHSIAQIPVLYLEDPQEYPRHEGKKRFQNWIRQYQPDGCICLNRFILDWFKEMKMRIPEDVSVAMLDFLPEMKNQAAGVEQKRMESGMKAIDIVIAQLNRGEVGIPPFQASTLISGEWVPGPTMRKPMPTS